MDKTRPIALIAGICFLPSLIALAPGAAAPRASEPPTPQPAATAQVEPAQPVMEAIPGPSVADDEPGRDYIVRLARGVSPRQALDDVPYSPIKGPAFHGALIRASKQEAARLAAQPGVIAVERDKQMSIFADDKTPPTRRPLR